MTRSPTNASKLGEVSWSTRLSVPSSNRSSCVAASAASPLCGTTAPFGRPVDPEV